MRICSGPGCLRAVPDGTRFCDECTEPSRPTDSGIKDHTSGYDADLDALRTGPRWAKLRRLVIQAQPLCARCDKRISEIVDHIVPAREAIAQAQLCRRFFDKFAGYFLRSNLQGLCRACHYLKTLEDKLHTGPWPDVIAIEDAAPKKKYSF